MSEEHYTPRTPGRVEKWLKICQNSHDLFCPCGNWKRHIQLCLFTGGEGATGGDGHATTAADFDLGGIEDLIAAAER
nr:ORF2 [Torque teno sus virus k2b]